MYGRLNGRDYTGGRTGDYEGEKSLEELLPAGVTALLHEALHLLRARASGDEEGIGHVDDDEVVHAQEGDQPSRARHDDAARRLLRDHCGETETSGKRKVRRMEDKGGRSRTEAAVPKDAGLVRLGRQKVRERREVSDVIPTCHPNAILSVYVHASRVGAYSTDRT